MRNVIEYCLANIDKNSQVEVIKDARRKYNTGLAETKRCYGLARMKKELSYLSLPPRFDKLLNDIIERL